MFSSAVNCVKELLKRGKILIRDIYIRMVNPLVLFYNGIISSMKPAFWISCSVKILYDFPQRIRKPTKQIHFISFQLYCDNDWQIDFLKRNDISLFQLHLRLGDYFLENWENMSDASGNFTSDTCGRKLEKRCCN